MTHDPQRLPPRPVAEVRPHLETLLAGHLSLRAIARAAGVNHRTVRSILGVDGEPRIQVRGVTATRLLAVTAASVRRAERRRSGARRRCCSADLATVEQAVAGSVPFAGLTHAEAVLAVTELTKLGLSHRQIGDRLRWRTGQRPDRSGHQAVEVFCRRYLSLR